MQTMMQIFSDELGLIAKTDPSIVGMSADVKMSTGLGKFAELFPDRYFEMGISEQNMIGVAAGMALEGKKVITSTYACFSPARTWEQIRNSVCGQNANVKIVGAHIGVGSGRDGETHQCFEDIALMSCLPNMKIYSPATDLDVRLCVRQMIQEDGPAYIRLSARYVVEKKNEKVEINKIRKIKNGTKIAVISTGSILNLVLKAVSEYETVHIGEKIAVFSAVVLSPLNKFNLIENLFDFDDVICVEEHQKIGGFSSLIASIFATFKRSPALHQIGVNAKFGASMKPDDLYEYLEISKKNVLQKLNEITNV